MAWGSAPSSAMFQEFLRSVLGEAQTANVLPAAYGGLVADTLKVALYDNDITPNRADTRANSAYNAGQWVSTGNEVTDATNWVAGGRALSGNDLTTPSAGVVQFAASNLAGGGTLTLTNAYGCLVYDDTITAGTGGVADLGVSYHYFGGGQSVTSGTFTIVWHANGLFRITV